jgi:hypothetical protein
VLLKRLICADILKSNLLLAQFFYVNIVPDGTSWIVNYEREKKADHS